ncbi:tetratricopeptide repeat protein [Catellatospora vulcania]|uniref:tetratricopeptide repeat protein n=1 Tax=Catellatospora vulcania TaxID=1460450 RepID=UPI001E42BD85|nr:tetratricopeptide repeat protein [Catellatospora vulcania]
MSKHLGTLDVSLARVLSHCGGNPAQAAMHLARAIASAPQEPEPYEAFAELRRSRPAETAEFLTTAASTGALAANAYVSFLDGDMDTAVLWLGSVVGHAPGRAWSAAPWFSDQRFLASVNADALAEAALRTTDGGHDLAANGMQARLAPWFQAIGLVSARDPRPEAMARMAIMLRACGLTRESLALCDQADAVEPVMFTEVVRAGTWRRLGDPQQAVDAFERALALEPANWSLYLDVADLRAELGDFAAAVESAERGLRHEPAEVMLLAGRAAYRTRLTGTAADLTELIALARQMPDSPYRSLLIDRACGHPHLPADLVATAREVAGEAA